MHLQQAVNTVGRLMVWKKCLHNRTVDNLIVPEENNPVKLAARCKNGRTFLSIRIVNSQLIPQNDVMHKVLMVVEQDQQ